MSNPATIDVLVFEGLGLVEDWLFEDDSREPVDFTGYSGQLDVRSSPGEALLLQLTSVDDEITFPDPGVVRLAKVLGDLPAGTYLYALALTPDDGVPDIWALGDFKVVKTVVEPT